MKFVAGNGLLIILFGSLALVGYCTSNTNPETPSDKDATKGLNNTPVLVYQAREKYIAEQFGSYADQISKISLKIKDYGIETWNRIRSNVENLKEQIHEFTRRKIEDLRNKGSGPKNDE